MLHVAPMGTQMDRKVFFEVPVAYDDPVDRTTYTSSALAVGPAAADRYVYVGVNSSAATAVTVNSMTIGGVAATLVEAQTETTNGNVRVEIWRALVPTGTTVVVEVTWSGTSQRCGMTAISAYKAHATVADTGKSDATPPSDTLAVPAGGAVFGFAAANGNAGFSWTGPTERIDNTLETTTRYSAASEEYTSAQASLTVTATEGASAEAAMVCVALKSA